VSSFAERLIAWHRDFGRHDLPWQNTRDPYRIWLSEVMLQQTQVVTVIPYYERFLAAFPTLAALAEAPLERVLQLWSGLGYYSRARNLHRCAREVMSLHGGVFPRDPEAVAALPGVGRSTAAAICAFAHGTRAAILDGNVKRVLARWRGIDGFPGERSVEQQLWEEAEALLPASGVEVYTQALMDLGASVCVRRQPVCLACPVSGDCVASRSLRVDELPTPRPRKVLPERSTTVLLVRHADTVLLERRPPSGVWGGLWSLPELSPNADPQAMCRERFCAEVAVHPAGPPFVHTFTHFRLTITPLPCTVRALADEVSEPGLLWLNRQDVRGAALPAPIKRLLLQP
jgi:A/G-specific adenine glycosylase